MGSHLKNTLAAELVFVNRVEDFFTVAVADDDIRLGEGGGLLRIGRGMQPVSTTMLCGCSRLKRRTAWRDF